MGAPLTAAPETPIIYYKDNRRSDARADQDRLSTSERRTHPVWCRRRCDTRHRVGAERGRDSRPRDRGRQRSHSERDRHGYDDFRRREPLGENGIANGRYTIIFPNGDGDYLAKFVALGYSPKQYELKRAADEDILVANATLGSAVNQLDAVHVPAPRDKANRNDVAPDIGGTEKTINTSSLTADQLGDLAAMAATIPGVNYVAGSNGDPSGFSVLGLTPDQNSSTLNGMNSSASTLPADAQMISTVTTSPYDVSRGGFAGAQQSTRLRSGSNFINQGFSLRAEAPSLQYATASARALGQEYTSLSLGGQTSGPISIDKAFYNFSYQLGQRSSDLASPLNTDSLGFTTAGLSPDSVSASSIS